MTSQAEVIGVGGPAPQEAEERAGIGRQILDNIKAGNLGSWPVVVGLAIIVLVFSLTAQNFFTAGNFDNVILQMAGTTMLAYGVVFVLLLGEIDLSIGFISGIGGLIVAEFQRPDLSFQMTGLVCILFAVLGCMLIGLMQGSWVALIGVPSFVVTLAGYQIWQGVIQKSLETTGPIIIQDTTINNTRDYFFPNGWWGPPNWVPGGWTIALVVSALYVAGTVGSFYGRWRAGVPIRNPLLTLVKPLAVTGGAFLTVWVCYHNYRQTGGGIGLPLALVIVIASLVILTYVAKRTTFGRHVYAVGGNAEAARRAGINVARIRILVFMIAGAMAGLGGVILAANLHSVDLQAGGGTLLLDSISAAVIGGVSLFGGRGEVRAALLGSLVIATIANGLYTFQTSQGIIYMVTGGILLFAVTLDTVARRQQAKAGR